MEFADGLGGNYLISFHVKLRKISDITATLPFTEFDFMQKYRESFAVSEHRQTPPAIARLALQTDWTMGLSYENGRH